MKYLKKGWFIRLHHDLYAGVNFIGPYETNQASKQGLEKYKEKNSKSDFVMNWDEEELLELEYIKYEGRIYPLHYTTATWIDNY